MISSTFYTLAHDLTIIIALISIIAYDNLMVVSLFTNQLSPVVYGLSDAWKFWFVMFIL